MKRSIFIILLLCSLSSVIAENLVNSINDFGFNLLKKLPEDQKNIAISPYSIFTAISMTSEGANNRTLSEMRNTLMLTDSSKVAIEIKQLQKKMLDFDDQYLNLHIANAIWLHNNFKIQSDFQKTIQREYMAELRKSDMNNTDQTLKDINGWVKLHTNNKIPSILEELDPSTRLILLNAIYFKADWNSPFTPDLTRKENFWQTEHYKIEVDMMHQISHLPYYKDARLQALKLNYKKCNFSLLVLLPNPHTDMYSLLQELDDLYFQKINSSFNKKAKIDLALPHFKLDYQKKLNDPLKKMGMELAFSDYADFSRINAKKDLYIDQIQHRAFLEVNEIGTEAAATTAVAVALKSAGPPPVPIKFYVDHPFIFILQYNPDNLILFSGIINDPE